MPHQPGDIPYKPHSSNTKATHRRTPTGREGLTAGATDRNASRWWWLLVHAWLAYHLVAITVAPASVPPTSDALSQLWRGCRHYLQVTFFNHGYHYFAPSPGTSTTLRYVAKTPEGTASVGQVPDPAKHTPRLRYHRYLMMTEYLGSLPPGAEEVRDSIAESYAYTLAQDLQAAECELLQVVHDRVAPERIVAGGAADDPATYETQSLLIVERVEP